MSLVSELRQITQVLGPLITSVEIIPEEDMDSMSFIDREVEVDESGIDEQDAETFTHGLRSELD